MTRSAPQRIAPQRIALLPRLLLAALFALAVPTAVAHAGDEGWQHALPPNVILFLGTDSVSELSADWDESGYGRLLADAALAPLRESMRLSGDDWGKRALEALGVNPLSWPGKAEGAAAFVVLEIAEEYPDAAFPFMFAVLVDVGENREDLEVEMEATLDTADEADDVLIVVDDLDGEMTTTLQLGDGGESGDAWVTYAFQGTTLVLCAGELGTEEQFDVVWRAVGGEADEVLGAGDRYATIPEGFEDAGVLLYLDVARVLGHVVEGPMGAILAMQGVAVDGFSEAGLLELGPIFQGFTFDADGASTGMGVTWGEGGLLSDFLTAIIGEESPNLMNMVPASVYGANALSLSPVDMFDETVRSIVELSEVSLADVVAQMAELDAQLGFSLRDDLLANLSGQVAFFTAPVDQAEALPLGVPPELGPLNYGLVLGLEDGEAMRTLVDGLIEGSPLRASVKQDDFLGWKLKSMPAPVPIPGIKLNWVIADDFAVMSLAPSLVHDVVRRKSSPDLPSVGNDEEYLAELERHPARHTMVTYGDPAYGFNNLLISIKSGLAAMLAGGGLGGEAPPLLIYLSGMELLERELVETYLDRPAVGTLAVDEVGLVGLNTGP